jgi:transporter family protein
MDYKIAIESSDQTNPGAGRIGAWTKADSTSYFDDLKVESLRRVRGATCHSETWSCQTLSTAIEFRPMTSSTAGASWFVWAVLSAVFAALTAIFAKIGLVGIDSDLATLVRTVIILAALGAFVFATGKWSNPLALPLKTLGFLVLSGLATGASWACYFRALKVGEASKVAPVDKLSLLLVVVLAFVFLGERPSTQEWIGVLMIGAGVMVLALK